MSNIGSSRKKLVGVFALDFGRVLFLVLPLTFLSDLGAPQSWEEGNKEASANIVAVRPNETGVILNLSVTVSHHMAIRVTTDLCGERKIPIHKCSGEMNPFSKAKKEDVFSGKEHGK